MFRIIMLTHPVSSNPSLYLNFSPRHHTNFYFSPVFSPVPNPPPFFHHIPYLSLTTSYPCYQLASISMSLPNTCSPPPSTTWALLPSVSSFLARLPHAIAYSFLGLLFPSTPPSPRSTLFSSRTDGSCGSFTLISIVL